MSNQPVPKTTFVGGVNPFGGESGQPVRSLASRVLEVTKLNPEGLAVAEIAVLARTWPSRVEPILADFVKSGEVLRTEQGATTVYLWAQAPVKRPEPETLIGKVEKFILEHSGVSLPEVVIHYPGAATKFVLSRLKQQGRCKVTGVRGVYRYWPPEGGLR